MISRASVRALLDRTEFEFRDCYRVLRKMKSPSSRTLTAEDILGFQPKLARALFELDCMYHALSREKDGLIARKAIISKRWFADRLRLIHDYQSALQTALATGKTLGDAFAWIFYRKNREALLQHFNHERVFHMPQGTGGRGELEFIDRFRSKDHYLVIYHGTTTFLRVGDVSIIDLRTRELAAIGELKTEQIGPRELKINLLMLGLQEKYPHDLFEPVVVEEGAASDQLPLLSGAPQSIRDRLDRQRKSMLRVIGPAEPDEQANLDMRMAIDELRALSEQLKTSLVAYQQVGDSLVLCGIVDRKRSLYSRLLARSSVGWGRNLNDTPRHALGIMKAGSDGNEILINDLQEPSPDSPLPLGMTPFFWWPLDLDFIEKVLFSEVLIYTLYNPVRLLDRLRRDGYNVKHDPKNRKYEITKVVDGKRISLEGFGYFLGLIVHQLFSEESVAEMLEDTLRHAEVFPEDSKVILNVSQHFL